MHVPVLEHEVGDALAPCLLADAGTRRVRVLVDATCGLGGHTAALVDRFRPDLAVAFDRDPEALARARVRLADAPCPVHFVHAPFSTMASALGALGVPEAAAILADLGVSSLQLDEAERGFSWRAEAPLDMRMDPTHGESAADLLARVNVDELVRILRTYGEEPDARRIARAIVDTRPRSTTVLARVVSEAMSAHERRRIGKRVHPATRTFQALRIAVNAELGELERLLDDAPGLLVVGGRLAIITFHSLEDRLVKHRFRELARVPEPPPGVPVAAHELPLPTFAVPSTHARGVVPLQGEIDRNPRARSARLRVLERVHA